METEKDKLLWKEAKKRAGFKNHLYTYLIVNVFLWIVWFFTDRETDSHGLPWPVFSSVGWGFGLFWHFAGTYFLGNKAGQVEREYQKLKDKENKQ